MSILESRRSIRKYLSDDIPNELIEKIILETMAAPSGSNTQPWKYLVIRDQQLKEAITKLDNNQQWMLEAPVFIVCLADASARLDDVEAIKFDDNSSDWVLKQVLRDSAIGATYLSLAIEQNGLGSCWTGWYEQKAMKQLLNVPDYMFVIGIFSVGYPAEAPAARARKKLSDVLMYDSIK